MSTNVIVQTTDANLDMVCSIEDSILLKNAEPWSHPIETINLTFGEWSIIILSKAEQLVGFIRLVGNECHLITFFKFVNCLDVRDLEEIIFFFLCDSQSQDKTKKSNYYTFLIYNKVDILKETRVPICLINLDSITQWNPM